MFDSLSTKRRISKSALLHPLPGGKHLLTYGTVRSPFWYPVTERLAGILVDGESESELVKRLLIPLKDIVPGRLRLSRAARYVLCIQQDL